MGVLDETLSDRLQAKADLTLEQAVQISRQSEARKQNWDLILENLTLFQFPIRMALIWWRSTSLTKKSTKASETRPKSKRRCIWCGRQQHIRELCPTKVETCNNRHEQGHFYTVFISLESSRRSERRLTKLQIPKKSTFSSSVKSVAKVDGHDTRFKLDTGAAVSIVSDREPWLKDKQLSNTRQILRGQGRRIPSKNSLNSSQAWEN